MRYAARAAAPSGDKSQGLIKRLLNYLFEKKTKSPAAIRAEFKEKRKFDSRPTRGKPRHHHRSRGGKRTHSNYRHDQERRNTPPRPHHEHHSENTVPHKTAHEQPAQERKQFTPPPQVVSHPDPAPAYERVREKTPDVTTTAIVPVKVETVAAENAVITPPVNSEHKPRHHGKHRRHKHFSKHRKRRPANNNAGEFKHHSEGEDIYGSVKKDDVVKE